MIADTGQDAGTWQSTHKSTSGSDADISGSDEERTIQDRVNEFEELYPEKASTFLVEHDPADPRERPRLREEVAEEYNGEYYSLTWRGALREFLEKIKGVRDLEGVFSDGDDTWSKRLLNSYDPEYLEKHYAQLQGLNREITEKFENPHTALLSLTASGTKQDGHPRGPVDHQLDRREAWPTAYKRLYDRMEALVEAGRIDDWMYLVIEEHHPGPFMDNSGYGHAHPVIIVDGEVSETDFYDVIDAWVEACPGAEFEAHDYRNMDGLDEDEKPIVVKDVAELNSAAGYLTKYLYPNDGEELLERPIEQLAHQAVKWATNTRRLRKSDRAGAAIKADLCRQKYEDEELLQEHGHGERLAHNDGRGPEIVCAACGSGWGIDPAAETVVEARREDGAGSDRGVLDVSDGEQLRAAWEDAGAAAAATTEGGVVGFDRPPGIEMVGYVVDGEEHPKVGSGGGVEMVPVCGLESWPSQLRGSALEGDVEPAMVSGGQIKQTLRRDRPPPG